MIVGIVKAAKRDSMNGHAAGSPITHSSPPATETTSTTFAAHPTAQRPSTKAERRARTRHLSLVVVGHLCIDHNTVDGVARISPGSPAYFISEALSGHPNITTTIIAAHGTDFDDLAGWLPIVTPTRGSRSLHFANTLTGTTRIQRVSGLSFAAPLPLTRNERAALRRADVVILAPIVDQFPAEYVSAVVDACSPRAFVALLPQGYLRTIDGDGAVGIGVSQDIEDAARECSLVVFSDEDTPDADVAAWRLAELDNRPRVIVTRARHGATIVSDIDSIDVPTTPIAQADIVNPVGPGDVFAAAVAVALARGTGIVDAVRAGNAAAGRHLVTPIPTH